MATVCSGLLVFRTSWPIVWLQVCAVHRPAAPCVLAREIRKYNLLYNKLSSQIWPGTEAAGAGRPGPRRLWGCADVRRALVRCLVARGLQCVGVQLVRCVLLGPRALPCVDAGHFVEP